MKQLRVSAAFNLCGRNGEDINEYVRKGLEFYKEMGFDAADFGTEALDLSSDGWKRQVEQILKDSDRIGIRFEVCHLPFIGGGAAKDEAYMKLFGEKMRRAIDAAKELGVTCAVMHPNGGNLPFTKYNRQEQFESARDHLAPFVEYGERVGVQTIVENMRVIRGMRETHRYAQTPEELCELADALGIGVCWDFGHANISGIKQSEGLAMVGKRLKLLHVNDNTAIDDDHILPFTGTVDWKDAMHGLALTGYEGLLNFELAANRVPTVPGLRRAYAAYVREAADTLMSYID